MCGCVCVCGCACECVIGCTHLSMLLGAFVHVHCVSVDMGGFMLCT